MDFNDSKALADYFDDLFDIGIMGWYDGPLETLYASADVINNPQADDLMVYMQYANEPTYHYHMKVIRVEDYARYWMGEITCNQMEDRVIQAYTIRLVDDSQGIQRFVDVIPVPNPDLNWQTHTEYLYYDNQAHQHTEIDAFFQPVIQHLKRVDKLDNLLA